VDCFTLLQENSTRTENSLRGAFSQAANCSPCVLLLRHLEALMHITQVPDPTQGERAVIHTLVNREPNSLKSHELYVLWKSASTDYYNPGGSQDTHWWWLEPPTPLRNALRAFLAVSSTRLTSRWVVVHASVPRFRLKHPVSGRTSAYQNLERALGR